MRLDGGRKSEIAWMRIISLLGVVVVSAWAGYKIQPYVSGNKDAISVIVTVFSILAGFLIAVISFIGDPGARGWKELQNNKKAVKARLRRHSLLFYMYLLTLGFALAITVIPDSMKDLHTWLERLFSGTTVFVFLASFTLPSSLVELQMDKYTGAISEKLPDAAKKKPEK